MKHHVSPVLVILATLLVLACNNPASSSGDPTPPVSTQAQNKQIATHIGLVEQQEDLLKRLGTILAVPSPAAVSRIPLPPYPFSQIYPPSATEATWEARIDRHSADSCTLTFRNGYLTDDDDWLLDWVLDGTVTITRTQPDLATTRTHFTGSLSATLDGTTTTLELDLHVAEVHEGPGITWTYSGTATLNGKTCTVIYSFSPSPA